VRHTLRTTSAFDKELTHSYLRSMRKIYDRDVMQNPDLGSVREDYPGDCSWCGNRAPSIFRPSQQSMRSAEVSAMDVTFSSGNNSLSGQVFKPAGSGPFPELLWNHGSERDPRSYLPALARPFVRAGYVVFA